MRRLMVTALSTFILFSSPIVGLANPADLTEKILEWEKQGIDPNHSEVIDKIRDYIEKNIDDGIFASLHIDREERDLGILVFSFTEPIAEEHKQAMEQFLTEHAEIQFREVEYTEDQLLAKLEEMDFEDFKDEGITIHHTSLDTIGNKIEVGISPYSEENVNVIKEQYGYEMITVVESDQSAVLEDNEQAETANTDETQADDKNFLKRILASIKEWVGNLF
ncbi:hypothetical protein GH741_12560 [Aquibacillus halophilus]|uniref:Uncharacterized protein n=1 Tax=Aquibacillus halophilus TaxID=930132 RepID=A0A6A8DID1_9BACI|nr:hypothetical protein [Aquibacillus halophilus]MRH43511.1 hypothetical protein [Aquibacillus halophilus]